MKENSNEIECNSIEEDIEIIESIIEEYENCSVPEVDMQVNVTFREKQNNALNHILSDYKRVLKENEHKTEKIENQKAELAILNKKQKDLNKLQNTLSSYKGQFIKQEKENKKINSLIRKLKKDSKERQWIQTVDDEYLAYTEKAMYADELLSFLRGEE